MCFVVSFPLQGMSRRCVVDRVCCCAAAVLLLRRLCCAAAAAAAAVLLLRAVLNAAIFLRILPPNVRSQEAARI